MKPDRPQAASGRPYLETVVAERARHETTEEVRTTCSFARAERLLGREYHGPFLIELLQNAADAWRGDPRSATGRSRVAVVVGRGRLLPTRRKQTEDPPVADHNEDPNRPWGLVDRLPFRRDRRPGGAARVRCHEGLLVEAQMSGGSPMTMNDDLAPRSAPPATAVLTVSELHEDLRRALEDAGLARCG